MTISKTGNFTDNAMFTLEKRYLLREDEKIIESPDEMFTRISKCLAGIEKNYGATAKEVREYEKAFFDVMWNLDFMPNSPTLMNAGTGEGTLSACYVLDIDDSMESITKVIHDQAFIEKYGGGVGFSLSGIRPKNSPIKSTQGKACGPIQVLKTLSQVGEMITQGGKRDGAHMAILSVYHPDIEEFITCKQEEGVIANFNISIGADSMFMNAVKNDEYINLTWPLDKKSYIEPQGEGNFVKAKSLYEKVIAGAWKNGEPGTVWLDRINQDNTTPALGDINATNPCGEQPLLSGESCNLGSLNLANFVTDNAYDSDKFEKTVRLCVRLLDNVVDANNHPTDQTNEMNKKTRKIGLGVMGWADMLTKMSIQYDSEEALSLGELIASTLKDVADDESMKLGKIKGNFPAFDDSILNKKNGGEWDTMRNAWRLSIAPTGTISMISNGASGGIEPHFALAFKKLNMSSQMADVELYYTNKDVQQFLPEDLDVTEYVKQGKSLLEFVPDDLKKYYQTTDKISGEWHVRMQAVWQKHIDSGISKTINLPNDATEEDISDAYNLAWTLGCKGITVYRAGSREKEVLQSTDGVTAKAEAPPTPILGEGAFERPDVLPGQTWKVLTGHGNMYVNLNFLDGKVVELFANLGKSGATTNAQIEALGRVISTALQHGVPASYLSKQLRGINSDKPVYHHNRLIRSAPDALAWVLDEVSEKVSAVSEATQEQFQDDVETVLEPKGEVCPDCGIPGLAFEEGCMKCYSCGYSAC